MKNLDKKAVWIFVFQKELIGWLVISFFLINTFLVGSEADGGYYLFFNLLAIIFGFGISYAVSKLRYKYYKYELAHDGFHCENGIIWKKYISIPYERIQNVDINRGILARLLGLSDLDIQTAAPSANARSVAANQ